MRWLPLVLTHRSSLIMLSTKPRTFSITFSSSRAFFQLFSLPLLRRPQTYSGPYPVPVQIPSRLSTLFCPSFLSCVIMIHPSPVFPHHTPCLTICNPGSQLQFFLSIVILHIYSPLPLPNALFFTHSSYSNSRSGLHYLMHILAQLLPGSLAVILSPTDSPPRSS